MKFHGGLRLLEALAIDEVEQPDKQTLVIHGPTGLGKSRCAWELCKPLFSLLYNGTADHPPQKQFWDGYCQQKYLLLDEFHCQLSMEQMLRILDRYPLRGEVKCTPFGVALNFSRVVILTNVSPDMWFLNSSNGQTAAFMRRLTYVIDCTGMDYEGIKAAWPAGF